MTSHFTDGRRPDNFPDSNGDAALDAVLAATSERMLAILQATLDLDAGLATVHAAAGTSAAPPTGNLHGQHEHGELEAVCQVLGGYLADLDPVADRRTSTPKGMGGSVLSLGAVHRLLQELLDGLLTRTLDRDNADRLVCLVEHNAAEAGQLLGSEECRATRRTRRQVEAWAEVTADIRSGIAALRPRILRLFDGAGQAAPREPAPHLPVYQLRMAATAQPGESTARFTPGI